MQRQSIIIQLKFTTNTSNMTSVTEVRSASVRLFTGMWHPLVSVIITLYYVAIIFHCRVWYRTMRVFEVRASPSSSRLPLCQISFLTRHPLLS